MHARLRGIGLVAIGILVGAVLVGGAWRAEVRAATRSASCPNHAPHVRSSRIGAQATLVPDQPQTLLLCRYDGPFGAPGAKLRQRLRFVAARVITDPARVRAMAAELNRVPKMTGAFSCPASTGAAIVGFFGYATGPDDPVRVDLSGCETASNGYVIGLAGDDRTTVLGQLEALVHARRARTSATRTALLSGYIRLCGGPAPGRCWPSTIGVCVQGRGCVQSDRVVAINAAGRIAAQQKLRPAHSRYGLLVAPGNYAVELLADGKHAHDQLMQTRGATARAGHAATVIFRFDVP